MALIVMHFDHMLLFAIYCDFIGNIVLSQENENSREYAEVTTPEPTEEPEPPDHHTFVALIDIVFTDGSKRTCTGTIIHDNVVITAAHCFIQEYSRFVKPELTASFVVIGTKKMFATGYEQYLPIERVVTHPKFKAWTADLCLVFTFAAMTSDKPGKVMPLAEDQEATPVDSNVTVFSWGHCKEDIEKMKQEAPTQTRKKHSSTCPPDSSCEMEVSVETGTVSIQEIQFMNNKQRLRQQKLKKKFLRTETSSDDLEEYKKKLLLTSKRISRYLTDAEKDKFQRIERDDNNYTAIYRLAEVQPFNMKSYYRNWRRQMGSAQNELLVESFDLMNIQMCKKIIQKAMPAIYAIKHGNDVMCYSSEEHYITSEDAGAPAVRNGQLVSVTVGGAECDGDQVALGMKMSCYCSWIARHLPGGGDHLNCCKNCCIYTEDGNSNKIKSYRNVHVVGKKKR